MNRTLSRSFVLSLLLTAGKMPAQAQQGGEANLKAVFIFHFTRYIEWDSTMNNDKNNFVIGVIGNTPVSHALAEVARNNRVNNKRIIIRYYGRPEEIDNCQILFIPRGLPFSLASILQRTKKGTLTVSEDKGYAKQGTALNFIINNDKLKFEANLKVMNESGLKASSQLLKLATIVD